MKEDIKNFVEKYNKKMNWNNDIIKFLGKKNIPKDILKEYLSINFIDEEKYDLENASLYEYGPNDSWRGTFELQVFSNEKLCTTYFWIKSDETEEDYKTKRIEIIKKEVNKKLNELYEKIKDLTLEYKKYNKFNKKIN